MDDQASAAGNMPRVLLRNVGVPAPTRSTLMLSGGLRRVGQALKELQPAEVVDVVLKSGLRGRGGAGFGTGSSGVSCPREPIPLPGMQRRRRRARNVQGPAADGTGPARRDRGIALSCYACEVEHAFLYIRGSMA